MKEYEVYVIEELESTVTVEAQNKHDAYEKAKNLLMENFNAPYHNRCEIIDYKVTEIY